MKYTAGFLKVACALTLVLMRGADAAHAHKGSSCSLKEIAALTKSQVAASLTDFDKANGKHLGTWSPGFPELRVHRNSTFSSSDVQCSLHFMAKGLEKILEDQENNLNPKDETLHQKLRDSIYRIVMLTACVRSVHGDKCSSEPPSPRMPERVFERKQWSHTLLKAARDYLNWLQSELSSPNVQETNGTKHKTAKATHQGFLAGSLHPL
ncbi:uncharacterized protein LOC125012426 [Mugil cephalus]|uniref:uncharacterized protein LOC125012426 n=1 Tax=Mugil cephalus TaxID=48193 RepID=UPI001FB603E5|nr:uncharacterized protein LOC125012426 [Mugil cephalus]